MRGRLYGTGLEVEAEVKGLRNSVKGEVV